MRSCVLDLGDRLHRGSLQYELDQAMGAYSVTGAIIAGAVVGAAGNYMSAKQANKKKTAHTEQTTTQNPFAYERINPDINTILDLQRGVALRGAPRVDAKGQVVYDPLPSFKNMQAAAQEAANPTTPTKSAAKGKPAKGPSTWTNAKGELMAIGAGGKAVKAPAGSGGGGVPGVTKPAGPNLSTPQGIFSEVAKRGLAAGDTPTITAARNATANILGAAGQGGSAAAGEQTGYEGYNPILDRLTGTLEGDVNSRAGRDLLMGFLGENNRAGGAGSGTGGAAGGPRPGGSSSRGPTIAISGGDPTRAVAQRSIPAGAATPGVAGQGVPDTMVPDSFFGTETRKIFDEQANDAELQAVIDAMNKDVERGMFRDIAQLDAAAAGSGRLGGSTWNALNRDAREEALQEMLKTSSQVRVGDRESRRSARLNALQGVNQRDLGLLGANVQREGIAAGERSARAASAASAGAAADQLALAKRGQDLSAIGALLENERFSLGQLGDVGAQLSGDRLNAMGMVPGLEGIGLSGLNAALGAGGGLVDMRGQDVQARIAGQQAAIARAGQAQQLGMFNAGQSQAQVNDYLRTVLGIGGMGGTSTTRGINVQPGLGVSTGGAAAMGAMGGAATGAGLYLQGRQTGAWG